MVAGHQEDFGFHCQSVVLTKQHPAPYTAARSILGLGHPREEALVSLLRRAYDAGFQDSGVDGEGVENEDWTEYA